MVSLAQIKTDLKKKSTPEKIKVYQWFFKTGKGQYGEGDIFLGLTSAEVKAVAKKYQAVDIKIIASLLYSKIHEERMTALRILIYQYNQGDGRQKKKIYSFYLKNARQINNWDLVDVSAPNIVGDYLLDKNRKILYKLAKSKNLWEKRISILATFTFLRNNDFIDCLKIAKILLTDQHDLIHKAVGWMLREIGKREQGVEEEFLKKHYQVMPRTMLRYAIERFSTPKRKFYLKR